MSITKKLEYTRTVLPGVEIKRCSHTHQSYKHHVHRELSLGYIVEGMSDVEFGGKSYVFGAGDGIVIPAMLSHMCSPRDSELWQVVMLYIDLSYYGSALSFTRAARITSKSLLKLKAFVKHLESGEEPRSLDPELAEILLEVEKTTQASTFEDSAMGYALHEIYDYILANYDKSISLDGLEGMFGVNKFTIIRGFKSAYNTTPSAFQLQVKVTEAKKRLAAGCGVLDVCAELGFYDQAHFIREFKKMNGVTPYAYIKSAAAK